MLSSPAFVFTIAGALLLLFILVNLGRFSHLSLGGSASPAKALREAAERGDIQSQIRLAKAYGIGDDSAEVVEKFRPAIVVGIHQDLKKAAHWWTKAAEQGDVGAQRAIAVYYGFGIGVSKDYSRAVYWARKAAAKGDSTAQELLDSYRTIVAPGWGGPQSKEERQLIREALDQ